MIGRVMRVNNFANMRKYDLIQVNQIENAYPDGSADWYFYEFSLDAMRKFEESVALSKEDVKFDIGTLTGICMANVLKYSVGLDSVEICGFARCRMVCSIAAGKCDYLM